MEDAFGYASDVIARAAAAGDRAAELCARIEQEAVRTYLEPEGAVEQLAATIEEALPVFQAAGDDFGLFTAYLGRRAGRAHARQDGRRAGGDRTGARACPRGWSASRFWRSG